MPSSAFVVCSTPRSGSGLLCRALAETGLAGAPAEYLTPASECRWRGVWARGVTSRRTWRRGGRAAAPPSESRSPGPSLDDLRRELRRRPAVEVLDELFPDAAYVSIERNEVNRQAVSLWTALNTGVWRAT